MNWLYRLDGALKLENYRHVAHETLTESGDIALGGTVPDDLNSAMDGIQNVNDWRAIGQQLALLKRRSDFRAVYLRAEHEVAKLAVVCEISGAPSSTTDYRPTFDYSWVCAQSLEPHLKDYQLSPELIALITSLVRTYGGDNSDLIQKAVSWLLVALQVHASGGGPNSAFIGACGSGLDSDLEHRLGSILYGSDFQKKKVFGFDFHPPTMQGLAWDISSNRLMGHAELAVDRQNLASGLG